MTYPLRTICCLALFIFSTVFTEFEVRAQWTNRGNINGVQVYRDERSGLEWTTSLSRTRTAGAARQKVANLGFRLPSHSEFRSLERNGGIRKLGMNTTWAAGFYWESSGGLVNGNGGNFSSKFPSNRARIGDPFAIGVRRGQGGNQGTVQGNQGGGQGSQSSNQGSQVGSRGTKIHMLFVWGTKAEDTQWATLISKRKIEKMLDEMGFSKKSSHVGTYHVLEGDDAHPKNILATCRALSQKAGPNDAVFVYILCHGATTIEDNDASETRIHALSPICTGGGNMDLRNIGVRRSSIMREIKSKNHRLDVLITDSCSVLQTEGPDGVVDPCMVGTVPLLYQLLLTAKGTININSSHPNSDGLGRGERALGWIPIIENVSGQKYLEEASDSYGFSGTVFTNAFIETAEMRVDPNQDYPVSKFIGDLKNNLALQYEETKKMIQKTGSGGIEDFMGQPTQTLTQFNDWGVALP